MRKELVFEGVEEVISSFCTYEQRREYWGKTWLRQELLENPIMGNGIRSSKRQVRLFLFLPIMERSREKGKGETKES